MYPTAYSTSLMRCLVNTLNLISLKPFWPTAVPPHHWWHPILLDLQAKTLTSSLTLLFVIPSASNLPENLVGSFFKYFRNPACSQHLSCYHYVWASDIFHVNFCNLWTGFPASALSTLYNILSLGTSELSAQKFPMALHLTQSQSQSFYNGHPTPAWFGPCKLPDFISYSSLFTSSAPVTLFFLLSL